MSKFKLKVDEAMRKAEGLIHDCKICNGRTNQKIRIHTVYVAICWKCEDQVVIRSEKFKSMKGRIDHMIEMSAKKDKLYAEMKKELDNLSWRPLPPPPKPEM